MRIKTYYYVPEVRRVFTKREFARLLKEKSRGKSLCSLNCSDYIVIHASSLADAEYILLDRNFNLMRRTGIYL